MRLIHLLTVAGTFAVAAAANAVTVMSVPGAPDPGPSGGQSILVDFNSALPAGFTLTGNYAYATGTSANGAAPAGDMTRYLYASSALPGNSATLSSALNLSRVSFYWGSIDKYNTVDVLGAGGATIYSLNGSMLPPSNGDQSASSTNRRVSFTAGTGEVITGLKFISNGVAFEVDDVAGKIAGSGSGSTVTEPGVWTMLIAGFGLVGVGSRRRRMTVVAA